MENSLHQAWGDAMAARKKPEFMLEIRKLTGQDGYVILDGAMTIGFAASKKEAQQVVEQIRAELRRRA